MIVKELEVKILAFLLAATTLFAQAGFLAEGFSCAHEEILGVEKMTCCSMPMEASCHMTNSLDAHSDMDCCVVETSFVQYGSVSTGAPLEIDLSAPCHSAFIQSLDPFLGFNKGMMAQAELHKNRPSWSQFPSLGIAFQVFII